MLEDVARFSLDDYREAALLKRARHDLDAASRSLLPRLLDSRDADRDVGRDGDRSVERGRSLEDVVSANARRVQEALRSIEEVARGGLPPLSRTAHRIRFASYTVERRLSGAAWRRSALIDVRLYLLADPSVGSLKRAVDAVRGGVGMIQLRHKRASPRVLLREVRSLRRHGVPVLVNDRVDVAAEADGVHLGKGDLPLREARRLLGERKILGATTHTPAEARRAVEEGADYISVGPMFPTERKPGLPARGFGYLREALRLGVPVFCIGGITPGNVRSVVRVGGGRIAVCGAVMEAEDPGSVARRLRRALRASR